MQALSHVDEVVLASRALLAIVARTIAPALEQVSLPQFRVLVVLVGAGPHRVGALAERLDALPSTFSRALDRLEHGGWGARGAGTPGRRGGHPGGAGGGRAAGGGRPPGRPGGGAPVGR